MEIKILNEMSEMISTERAGVVIINILNHLFDLFGIIRPVSNRM